MNIEQTIDEGLGGGLIYVMSFDAPQARREEEEKCLKRCVSR